VNRPGLSLPGLLLPALALAVIASVIAYVIVARDALPSGPTDLVWDKTACAACQMHVGEPAFAAQVQLTDGRTLAFDDPGCLFLTEVELEGRIHAVWFHHCREDRWLRAEAVAFVAVEPTPMGFGLGAVDAGTPGSSTPEEARAQVSARAGLYRGER
jgi:hypothetical protein